MENYKVYINGKEEKLNWATVFEPPYNEYVRMPYANFVMSEGVEVKLHSDMKIESCLIRPLSYNIDYTYTEHEITINMEKPLKVSVEINGTFKNNILIFANAKREYKLGENIIRFPAGVTDAGIIDVCKDDTTVLLEDGAYVEGKITVHDCKNVSIVGCGILSMEKYPRAVRDNFENAVLAENCQNLLIEDVCLIDSVSWTCKLMGCDGVNVKNVKIIGCRGNSDGVDVCGSKNVTVEDIFTRTNDDSFVLKAFNTGNVENIVFKDSVLWNDFARPIEVGVEICADWAKNIVFENIDVIHSVTGYPIMGIHHGDRAVVSDIEFKNIRIEDAPGAQLFDVRITNSVWNRDDKMGRIENIKFSDIYLLEEQEIQPSKSRIQGYSPENNISGVTFENINLLGKFATNAEECQLNIMDFVDNVKFIAPEGAEKINLVNSRLEIIKPFELCEKCGKYRGSVRLVAENNTESAEDIDAYLKISPKNAAEYTPEHLIARLEPGKSCFIDYDVALSAGKYMVEVQSEKVNIENTWQLMQFDFVLENDADTAYDSFISDWYGNKSEAIKLWSENDRLYIRSPYDKLTIYTAMPVPLADGEVMFSVEETDFGEVSAVLNGLHGAELAPQLRCPAEITYVFKNEPKVKEIVVNEVSGNAEIPFEQLGLTGGCKHFWLEIEAEIPERQGMRYPFTMFRSVQPKSIAHMFANALVK